MAHLAAETYFFRTHKKNAVLKPLPPIKVQPYIIDYTIMAHQLQLAGANASPNLEIAAAAYDADGEMLNAVVSEAGLDTPAAAPGSLPAQRKSYKVEEVLFAPLNAATIRLAVRDMNTDRIGAMEINLPLAPEPASHAGQPTR